jgi:hypothetical protein
MSTITRASAAELAEVVLACPMGQPNDAEADTVQDYLTALLRQLWEEPDCFSGKRPFGSSSWQSQIYEALGRKNLISATFDGLSDGRH